MANKIGLHVVGGLGDVSLTRKYPALYQSDLTKSFEVCSIADIYDWERVKDEHAIYELLSEIERLRLKGKFNTDVRTIFKNSLLHSIKYYQLDKDNPRLPKSFFDAIEPRDVVDISVPNNLHLPLARQVLDYGGNLLVEKPLCSSLEGALRFRDHISRLNLNGRILTDAEHYSHYGNIKEFYSNFRRFMYDNGGGFGLGKIRGINLFIEEDEDFSSERNRETINREKSGGGMWLDTGIHALSFLKSIKAVIDHDSVEAHPYKSPDPNIQDEKYGETSMEVSFDVISNDYFFHECHAHISIGKGFQRKNKRFVLDYEKGRVELDMSERSLHVFDRNNFKIFNSTFHKDAFYHVFDDVRRCIQYNEIPFTSISKAIRNVVDVFLIYNKAHPLVYKKSENGKK